MPTYAIYPNNNWIIKTMTTVTRKQFKSHNNAFFSSFKFNRVLEN